MYLVLHVGVSGFSGQNNLTFTLLTEKNSSKRSFTRVVTKRFERFPRIRPIVSLRLFQFAGTLIFFRFFTILCPFYNK
jgi:hypothetical protein